MDRNPQGRQGPEEGEAREQGQIHCQDVPARRFGHFSAEKPARRRQRGISKKIPAKYLICVSCPCFIYLLQYFRGIQKILVHF